MNHLVHWLPGQIVAEDGPFEAVLDGWDKVASPKAIRLRTYLETRAHALGLLPDGPLFLHLYVDVQKDTRLLGQPDLDNFLIPLVKHLGHKRFQLVIGTKVVGGGSRVVIGRALPAGSALDVMGWGYHACRIASIGDGKVWRQALHDELLARCPAPLAPGAVEAHFAWRVSPNRTWVNLWKPTCDTLGPILGEHPTANHAYNPDDGRITKVHLHVHYDLSLGYEMDLGMWWRLL